MEWRAIRQLLALVWLLAAAAAAPATQTASAQPPVARQASDQPFRRGVNVLGYDPYWTDSTKRRFEWRHFAAIRRAGFDFVRVNLHAFGHMDAANGSTPSGSQSSTTCCGKRARPILG